MAVFTIVGAGMMGSAMCWPLRDNQHQVRLVGTPLDEEIIYSIKQNNFHPKLERIIPSDVESFSYKQLSEAIQGTDVIIGGVSSFGVDWFAQTVGPLLRPEVPVLLVTKGLEAKLDGDLLILPEALNSKIHAFERGNYSFNSIAGPCIAHELAACRQTCVVFTGKNAATLTYLKNLLGTSYYHIWTSTDAIGVETCAAMKNAYALGVGLAVGMMEKAGPDGLANMYNPQAALFGQSCHEMCLLLDLMGGGVENITWLPGVGDLYVTVFGGRTVRLGKMLGQGIPFSQAREIMSGVTLESVEIITRVCRAMPKLAERGKIHMHDFPLLLHLNNILQNGSQAQIPWESFFNV
jgi:glycerol-3-phosphate dehydrogenase (NAD(P)+)